MSELEKLIVNIFSKGSIVTFISGRRNTGKTDLSLLISEILYDYGVMKYLSTNIKVTESDIPIGFIDNLQDLEFWCRDNRGKKLFVLDEAGKSFRRRSPLSKINIELIDNLQVLRHYSLSLLFIAPAGRYIDKTLFGTDILDLSIEKYNLKNALWFNHLVEESFMITDIPQSRVKFDTYNISTFKRIGTNALPQFKDKDLENLWMWSNGTTIKDLGIERMTFHRILKKFIKESMERERNK